jgi:hypothetical protein
MVDLRSAVAGVGSRIRSVKKTSGRLLFSGIGFSAAYFLDPEHGAARRQRIKAVAKARLHAAGEARPIPNAGDKKDPVEAPMQGSRPQFTTNGLSSVAH